jgi:hypothetical protein
MPIPASAAPGARAVAPSAYTHRKKSGKGRKVALGVIVAIVVIAGAGVAIKLAMTGEQTASSAGANGAGGATTARAATGAEPASARIGGESADAPHGGWVGVQELFAEQATVTIVTYADDSKPAQDFAADVSQPASIASIAIDDSIGKEEVAVDTSGATLKLADGTTRPAEDAGLAMGTVKQNADKVKDEMLPPFRCSPGQKVTGKLLLLPHGFDVHKLASVNVRINGQPYDIIGLYSGDAKHVEQMRGGKPPMAAQEQQQQQHAAAAVATSHPS